MQWEGGRGGGREARASAKGGGGGKRATLSDQPTVRPTDRGLFLLLLWLFLPTQRKRGKGAGGGGGGGGKGQRRVGSEAEILNVLESPSSTVSSDWD